MIKIIKAIVALTNQLHDVLVKLSSAFGLNLNDKQLHFVVIAIIGMFIYIFVDKLFKVLSRYSISISSFIYTFTVLLVIVFGIEVEQKITKRGNMDFADIVAGLWGFITIFLIYITIYTFIRFVKENRKKHRD